MPVSVLDRLDALEVDPAVIASDPSGRAWLPADLSQAIEACPQARASFQRFVAAELKLARLDVAAERGRGRTASASVFAADVMRRLPVRTLGLSARASTMRLWMIALGHALAVGAVWWMLTPAGGSLSPMGLLDTTRSAIFEGGAHGAADDAAVMAAALLAVGIFAVAVFGLRAAGQAHVSAGPRGVA